HPRHPRRGARRQALRRARHHRRPADDGGAQSVGGRRAGGVEGTAVREGAGVRRARREAVRAVPGPAAAQLHARQGRGVRRRRAHRLLQLLALGGIQRREPAGDQKSRIRRPLRHLLRAGTSALRGDRSAEWDHRGSATVPLKRRRTSAPAAPRFSTTPSTTNNHQLDAPPSWWSVSVVTRARLAVGTPADAGSAGAPSACAASSGRPCSAPPAAGGGGAVSALAVCSVSSVDLRPRLAANDRPATPLGPELPSSPTCNARPDGPACCTATLVSVPWYPKRAATSLIATSTFQGDGSLVRYAAGRR